MWFLIQGVGKYWQYCKGSKLECLGNTYYILVFLGCFQLFIKIEQNFKNCFLFESLGEESNISRYHIIGFNPKYLVYSEQKDQLIIENTSNGKIEKYICDNPYYALREIIPQNIISRKYAGGLVGFIGYDSINFLVLRSRNLTV